MNTLEMRPRITRDGCGIYEVGDPDRCYVRLFVTEGNFVLPTNHRAIGEEDLMEAYTQGLVDGYARSRAALAGEE